MTHQTVKQSTKILYDNIKNGNVGSAKETTTRANGRKQLDTTRKYRTGDEQLHKTQRSVLVQQK